MAKKKVCKRCKMFVEGAECPVCKVSKFSTNWQGRIYVLDPKSSVIADKVGIDVKGEFCLKCR
ncbi:TPA: DNA-directed RNA polymerase subunit E'' [Candidatus Woesearchaeota archaeon]|nr:DNA-directed RNA polymerase subunit E'' [Candidatus Woesearchaeota archaeon]